MNKKLQKYIEKLPGWLSVSEALFLEKIVKQTEHLPGVIVEIGSFCGKSTICLAQSKGKVYAVDPHQGKIEDGIFYPSTFKKFKRNIKNANLSDKVTPIVCTSEEAARYWKKKIRVLFIDGLHDEVNANLDFSLWSKHVVRGGIIATHDSFLRWCGSEKVAMHKIIRSKEFSKIGVVGSIVYGVKGKASHMQKISNLVKGMALTTVVQANHMKIILSDLSIIRNKFSGAASIST